jgi:hypothetical protein
VIGSDRRYKKVGTVGHKLRTEFVRACAQKKKEKKIKTSCHVVAPNGAIIAHHDDLSALMGRGRIS